MDAQEPRDPRQDRNICLNVYETLMVGIIFYALFIYICLFYMYIFVLRIHNTVLKLNYIVCCCTCGSFSFVTDNVE